MKEYKIILLSIAFFILVCVSDALFESVVFHEKPFWNSLFLDVSGHALYLRSVVTVAFLIFGFIFSRALARERAAEKDLEDRSTKLAETNRRLEQEIAGSEQLERQLRESERRYRTVADFTYDWETWTAPDGTFIWVSSSCQRITGYSASEFLEQPKLFQEIVHPDDLAAVTQHLREALENGKNTPENLDFRIIHKDGELRWINHVCQPVSDEKGNLMGRRASNRDITERRHAEEWLRLEKERLRSLIEGAPFGMIIVGADGTIHYVNPQFTNLFGYELPDVPRGKEWFRKAYPDPEYRKQVISDWFTELEKADSGEQVRQTYTVKCKDGTEKIVLFTPVKLPSLEHLVTCEDVTDRIKAEEEARRVQALLNSIVEHLPTPVFLKDADELKYALWNRACENLYGFSSQQVLGKTAHDFFPDQQADRFASQDRETLATGKLLSIPEQLVNTRNSGTRIMHTEKLPILDDRGRPAYLLGISQDITDRKRAEKELIEAREAAEQASRSKSEFLANMSHEIRTPINGIMGMTELALNTEITPEQHEYLEAVRISADSLLKVINDILDFSKIEAGKLELIDVQFRLRDVVGDTMTMLALQAHKKDIEIAYEVPPEIPDSLVGDPGRLRQVLVNLVSNSIKFTEKGEVVTRIQRVSEGQDGVRLHFTVTDTGIGIPPEKRDKIFRAFEQADGSTSRKYGGTGLGLAISAQFVRMMGGEIWVESEVGKGSTFNFDVRFALHKEKLDLSVPEETSRLQGMDILVVDDNATNRRILEQILVHWGMRPHLADSGPAALLAMEEAFYKNKPFDLIITDCMMPEMDGFELAERINRDQRLSTSTIIMLTSSGERGDASKCVKLGIAAYLLKPIKQSELLFTVSKVLQEPSTREVGPSLITRHSIRESRKRLRILLAEDNVINQRLTVRLLERMGHTVSVAANGRQAVDALEKSPFDLVFMDVQMPEMDGLEATVLLRQREKVTGRHVPVIAMTAYAMKGDKEKCLAAGMDGYMSKPISAQEVYQVIDQVASAGDDEARPTAAPAKGGEVLDRARLMDRVGGDADLLKEIVALFFDDYPKLLAQIREACRQNDPDRLERSAHALKGAVSNFAVQSAVEAALKLETMGRERNMAETAQALAHLEREISRTAVQLATLKEEIGQ